MNDLDFGIPPTDPVPDYWEPEWPHQMRQVHWTCYRYADSADRLPCFLYNAAELPAELWWPTFLAVWSGCDDTWQWKWALLKQARRHGIVKNGGKYLTGDAKALYDNLPDQVQIVRGCHRDRVNGIAWTLDWDVAASFAHGHRGGRVPDPVIASASIPKRWIMGVILDRGEKEILVDPSRLTVLSAEPYVHAEAA